MKNDHHIYNLSPLTVGIPPPLNVQASQASPSDPVEVSWSTTSDGATTITGYRIFYGNGEKNISLPSAATSITFELNVNLIGQTVSLCTEAEQLASQCTNVTVENAGILLLYLQLTDITRYATYTYTPLRPLARCGLNVWAN